MGFLEDLRRQRANEIEAQRQVELRREEERKQAEIRSRAEAVEKNRRRQLVEEARRRFKQSGMEALINELGRLGGYSKFYDNYEKYYNLSNKSPETYICTVIISNKSTRLKDFPGHGIEETKFIQIETIADGTIKFKGGLLGSTRVKKVTWEKSRATLEQALGRAYNSPQIERSEYRGGMPSGPGWYR